MPFFLEHHAYLDLMTSLRTRFFDIIHNNSLHYLPVSMASTLTTPMVTTLHTPPFCWLESGIRLCRAPNMRFVAVSDTIRELWSPIATIDRTVANGIDLDSFPFSPTADPSDYLIWYGRIVPEKGLHLAIDAARTVGRPLKIAGPISDPEYFVDEIEPRLGTDATYMGHLEHRALGRLVGGARVFLCTPRWEEPYGLVVAEALACGTPIAAFARGAIPALVDESCGALAIPDDVASLADATRRAMELDRLSCRRRAETICDADAMIDAYEALYTEMMKPSTSTSLPSFVPTTMAGAA